MLKVAKVRIIHVQRGLAVARLVSEFTRDNAPLLEDNFVMVGDRLDLSTATSGGGGDDKEKDKDKKVEAVSKSEPVAALKPQIVINSVELSSEAKAVSPPPVAPSAVDAPSLQ
ncbi:MAG: hypothetical protein HC902_12475 [Calothrix sp. SM1_5_4]|nr:hypothetical protein [Calothrix sp. SM1_5_4]